MKIAQINDALCRYDRIFRKIKNERRHVKKNTFVAYHHYLISRHKENNMRIYCIQPRITLASK